MTKHDPPGHLRPIRRGVREQPRKIAIEQGVAVAQQEAVLKLVAGMEDRSTRPRPDGFLGQRDAGGAGQRGLDIGGGALDFRRKMAGQQQEVGDAEAHELTQQPEQEGATAAGQDRLRRGGGEGTQARTETADQYRTLGDGCFHRMAASAISAAGSRPASTFSTRRPSISSTSNRQPPNTMRSPARGTRRSSASSRPARVW